MGESLPRLTPDLAAAVLARALRRGGDFAEIFAEDRSSLSLRLEDGKVEEVSSGVDLGASIRLVKGPTTSFGYADSLDEVALLTLADRLSASLSGAMATPAPFLVVPVEPIAVRGVVHTEVDTARKAEIVRLVDRTARGRSAEVRQVTAGYSEGLQRVWVANSEGTFARDERTRLAVSINVVAQREALIQTGRETVARTQGFGLLDDGDVVAATLQAVDKAVVMLGARPSPSGRMPVILANGFGGVLFHEACGHGLEADFILKKTSIWEGRRGQKVAEALVTAYDDGASPGMWGSNAIDDEGTATERTAVIEEGVLNGYLCDLLRGRRLGLQVHRQRAPAEFPAPALSPHDEHLFRSWRGARRRPHSRHSQGLLCEEPLRRTGGPRHRRFRVRRLGGVPHRERPGGAGGAGRHPHRQRGRGAADDRRGRRRPRRQGGHVWQGGAVGAGGHRTAHRPAARADGGGHTGLMSGDLVDIGRLALAQGSGLPGEIEVYVQHAQTTSIKVYAGEVESLVTGEPRGAGVRYVHEGRVGYAYTGDVGREALASAVRQAAHNAAVAEPDAYASLPGRPAEYPEVGGLWRPGLRATPVERKVGLALEAEARALAEPEIETVEESAYVDSATRVAIVSSAGVEVYGEQTFCYVYVSAHARRGDDVQTGMGFVTGREPDDLDADAAGREGALKAVRQLGAAPCPTGRYTVVLDREVAASVFGVVSQALTAEAVQKGRSLFAGRVGQRVAADRFSLWDDGLHPDGMATSPFDDEGVPHQKTALVGRWGAAGLPARHLHGSQGGRGDPLYRQRHAGFVPGFSRRLPLEPGGGAGRGRVWPTFSAGSGTGLYVVDITGLHSGANAVSGEFSVGASGSSSKGARWRLRCAR